MYSGPPRGGCETVAGWKNLRGDGFPPLLALGRIPYMLMVLVQMDDDINRGGERNTTADEEQRMGERNTTANEEQRMREREYHSE